MHNPLHNVAHPLWGILRLAILMGALAAILYVTAENFDATEQRTLVWVFLTAGGLETAPAALKKLFGGKQP